MRRKVCVFLFTLALQPPITILAQSAVVSTGGSVSKSTYQVVYSIGQVATACNRIVNNTIAEGVIQPLKIEDISKIRTNSLLHICVYPNPTTNIVIVECDNLEADTPVKLYSLNGNILQSRVWKGDNLLFDLSDMKYDVYLLQVKDRTFKIIKK